MAAHRASWKGNITFADISCAIALYAAASSSERISFNILNRKTGNRVRREFVDSESGDVVDHEDQVKGFETANGHFVVVEPDEIAAAIPESDKTLAIDAFVSCDEIDNIYFDKPYYLVPQENGEEAFALLRDGMSDAGVAAVASTVLFRRLRTLLIYPHDGGLIGTTLNFDYEVRPASKAFDKMTTIKIDREMLDLASHIIATKKGRYDAGSFEDRYEEALAELVKAKVEGKTFKKPKTPKASKPGDLLQALRDSAKADKKSKTKPKSANNNSSRRKTAKTRSSRAAGSARRKAG